MSLGPPSLARVLAAICCGLGFLCARAAASEPLQFNRDIRPILSDRCFKCHGPDKASRKGGLRLDVSEGASAERKKSHRTRRRAGQAGGKPALPENIRRRPGRRDAAAQFQSVTQCAGKGKASAVDCRGREIPAALGFCAAARQSVPLPTVKNKKWPRNEIDYFVLARLERRDLNRPKRRTNCAGCAASLTI